MIIWETVQCKGQAHLNCWWLGKLIQPFFKIFLKFLSCIFLEKKITYLDPLSSFVGFQPNEMIGNSNKDYRVIFKMEKLESN